MQLMGLFKCTDKRCKVFLLYLNEDNSFVMSKNIGWELRSHATCRDIYVIYYLKCNMRGHKETYIGKTVGDVFGLSRINQLITDCRTGIFTFKFPVHLYYCAMNNKECLEEPYLQSNIIMKLKESQQLQFYEKRQ